MKFIKVKKEKAIKLTRGQFVTVDANLYDFLNQWNWYAHYNSIYKKFYAVRQASKKDIGYNKKQKIWMHRFLLGVNDKLIEVDHIDHNPLNNTLVNLRKCTHAQNMQNSCLQKNNTSGYRGVVWDKQKNKWNARISVNKKIMSIGFYKSKEDAALFYNLKAKELHGEFAFQNTI